MRLLRGAQHHAGHADREVDAGVAFDGERLQRHRAVRSANQNVATDPDADGYLPARSDVVAGERASRCGPSVGINTAHDISRRLWPQCRGRRS